MFAAFTVWTFPGSSVRATIVSASTDCPSFTATTPARGSFRSRRTVVKAATFSPGVYEWAMRQALAAATG